MTHPSISNMLEFFEYEHLPSHLQLTSISFYVLAHQLAETHVHSQELSMALRKLLEAKDCAVRNAVQHHKADEPITLDQ